MRGQNADAEAEELKVPQVVEVAVISGEVLSARFSTFLCRNIIGFLACR